MPPTGHPSPYQGICPEQERNLDLLVHPLTLSLSHTNWAVFIVVTPSFLNLNFILLLTVLQLSPISSPPPLKCCPCPADPLPTPPGLHHPIIFQLLLKELFHEMKTIFSKNYSACISKGNFFTWGGHAIKRMSSFRFWHIIIPDN